MRASISPLNKQSLSSKWQQFLELLQRIRYGRIPRLRVQQGEPDLDRRLTWHRSVKILGENQPHPAGRAADFVLRREVVEFIRLVSQLGDGELTNLEIRNGLPFHFEVKESLST